MGMGDRVKVTFKPAGVSEPDWRVWEIDLNRDVKASEWIAVQKVSGVKGVRALVVGIQELDMLATKALLWLLMKRDMSTLSWEALDFTLDEYDIDPIEGSPAEQRAELEQAAVDGTLTEVGQKRLEELREAGVEAEVEDPKA